MSTSNPLYRTFSFEDWTESLILLIAAIHNKAILVYHGYGLRLEAKKKSAKCSVVQILSILAITAPFLYNALAGLNPWLPFLRSSSISCSAWMKATNFFYGLSKSVIYFLFMERLFTVFNGSFLSFSNTVKVIVRIFFGIYTASLCILTNVFSGSEFDAITGRCSWDPVEWAYPLMAFSCIIAELTISIAFSRRLVQLNALRSKETTLALERSKSNDFKDADKSSKTWRILLKSSVLTFITLTSTPLSIVLGFVFGFTGLWAALDSMVCCWMVMLMFSNHNHIYSRYCKKLEPCLSLRCLYYYTCYCCATDKSEKEDQNDLPPPSPQTIGCSPRITTDIGIVFPEPVVSDSEMSHDEKTPRATSS